MKKFLVVYMAPSAVIQEWMQKDLSEREAAEKQMQAEWREWMQSASGLQETAGLGKTTRITTEGASQVRNDLMMYSMVEADSAEAVADMFKKHPHLGIPQASIEIMEANVLPASGPQGKE